MLHSSRVAVVPAFGKLETASSSVAQEPATWTSESVKAESVRTKRNAADAGVIANMELACCLGDREATALRLGERIEKDTSRHDAERVRPVGNVEKVFTFCDLDEQVMLPSELADEEGAAGAQVSALSSVACGSGAQAVLRLRTLGATGDGNIALPSSVFWAQSVKPDSPSKLGGHDCSCHNTVTAEAQPLGSVEPEPRVSLAMSSAQSLVAPKRRSPKPEPRAMPTAVMANASKRKSVKPEPRQRPGNRHSAEPTADVPVVGL
eukprot:TRINITY_DN5172_c0_g1_i1.p1 TRINITY_DN5172_c0_g1~~TRINITY_DN5172_c0_g1_i1.p1  ORF type:complete len:264 (+),score=34.65 TRINITY_DN5172_c0_g1_i1:85-876(+)